MRFAVYRKDGQAGLAVAAAGDDVFHGLTEDETGYPGSLETLIKAGADLAKVGAALLAAPMVDLATVTLAPPVSQPGKILCVGLNYAAHARETGREAPTYPTIFVRFPSTLIGAGAALVRPRASEQLDYEAELVAVIGTGGRHIAKADALHHVVGYSAFNDGSVRDYQGKSTQWTMGKNFDATGAFGPVFVTADELPPGGSGLRIQARLNGETVQDSTTDDMIFDIEALIVFLSEVMTLEPGDIIVSGTPSGVGIARTPPLFLRPGDVCEIEIEGIGILRNPVIAEA
ncbi:fumarylacetoacetate hydrolase family protein [Magnetospirillum molischianum]|uniref:Putative bifunctional enzyme with isomerase/decarboxylase activity n=1 Tax=Magnetospirillum molischianum DSM 120 TaxID=1150626 RepID=H8FQS1_MAGML|nr:fumarylacetoacetate hydrolase family protein [Magnetospirillum molischianum]CCG40709.1 putative bifunctional enzyme with isomerase/decarboxylase activity (Includes:5-carboxymethyl-2-hydroxymuconate delta-isomerase/ 5-oxopent-3-ene-1,2,5-tricarboxylate decarboxylase) [Magnetospirillum molischianum DSM 120]